MPPTTAIDMDALGTVLQRGIPVIPLHPKTKVAFLDGWQDKASCAYEQAAKWLAQGPERNFGCVAKSGGVWMFDADDPTIIKQIEQQTGQTFPKTFYVRASKPEPAGHYYFQQTRASELMGNRKRKGGFDAQVEDKYVVAPGCIHPSGIRYEIADDSDIIPAPDWLIDWILGNCDKPKQKERLDATVDGPIDPDFAIEKFLAHYGFQWQQEGSYYITDVCPVAGYQHDQSIKTAFFFDGSNLGFNCFASGCDGSTMSVGEVIRRMNESQAGYPFPIWRQGEAGQVPRADGEIDSFPKTDVGNAEAFAAVNEGKWLFDHSRGWYRWLGHCWERDEQEEIVTAITQVVRSRAHSDPKWGRKQEQLARIQACERLVRSQSVLSTDGRDWNQIPYFLAVKNGVIDLRTGKLRDGQPEDRINVHLDVDFNANAQCPKWLKFVLDIMNQDAEMAAFMKRALGYSTSGIVKEQVMFLCCGGGSNGKNTLVETLKQLLGGYAHVTRFSTFLNSLNGESASGLSALACLSGRRFVVASEAPQNATLSSDKLKGFVHGDEQSAKYMFKDFFEFRPQAKLWLTTNDKPRVTDSSKGFWRSLYIIPFDVEFSDALGNKDKDLGSALEKEGPGILNWLVEGYLEYQVKGLMPPRKVAQATEEYEQESNPISEFLNEECEMGDGFEIKASDLYKSYVNWAEGRKVKPISNNSFGAILKNRRKHTKKGNVYIGLKSKW